MTRIRTLDEVTIANTAGPDGRSYARTFEQKKAQLDALRTALQTAAAAEVARRIAILNRRFPRHEFQYVSGNGVFYVYVKTPRGANRYAMGFTGFYGDFALRAEEQLADAVGYLEVRERRFAAKALADLWAQVEAIMAVAIEFEDATGWAL